MKKLLFSFVMIFYMAVCFNAAYAANAGLNGNIVRNVKEGAVIADGSIKISMDGNEVVHFKDSVTVTLNGAQWDYAQSGNINENISYEKLEANKIKLHINTNDSMAKGYTAIIPLNCRITKVMSSIKAVVNYGFDDIAENEVVFASGEVSRGYLDGSIKDVEQGSIIYKESGASVCNNLKIRVISADVAKTRDKIKVTLEGARFNSYKDYGRIACDRGSVAVYKKSADETTLEITFDAFNSEMKMFGYTLTVPLTAVITGTGDIKAVVDFGDPSVEPSSVVFARVDNGIVYAAADNPDSPIEKANTISSVTIYDDTFRGYSNNTKIEVQLNQVFHFVQTPKIEGTGKFEGKCGVELNKNDTQKAIITIVGNVETGQTGAIKLINPVIERSPNAANKFSTVEMTFTTKAWSDYNVSAVVAKYAEGANSAPPLDVKASNPNVGAKKYSALSVITITDNGGRAYKAGSRIMLSFDKGFAVFSKGRLPSVSGSGKFKDNCEFKLEGSQAYILIPKAAAQEGAGSIAINGIELERASEEAFEGGVNITAVVEGDSASSGSAAAAKYLSIYDKIPEVIADDANSQAAESDSAAEAKGSEGNTVKFKIGDINYYINGNENQLLAAPYIKDGYTMLPMRAIANIVGISNDSITYSDGTAVFSITDKIKLEVTAGSSEYVVVGKKIAASTSAEIINGTMFLPMRDLANAMGISNDNISFNSETKEITLITK